MLSPNCILQNRYRIIHQLSEGGMGTVYVAVDERLDATVALKECHFTDERLRKQFEREARLLARLRHPAMPRVIDHFNEGDGQFLVMDFIKGEDLSEILQCRTSPFQPDEVLRWANQLLDALAYLHSQDPPIIHRDIKPQNLKLTSEGKIMLLDFGLAKGFAGQISRVTTSGSIFGYTPNYAPLEQIQGTGTDPRSDLYSLAATIYHLLTGVVPPDVLTRLTATTDGLRDPLLPVNELNRQVSPAVATVLNKALAIGRKQRHDTAAELQESLSTANQSQTQTSGGKARAGAFMPSTVAGPTQDRRSDEHEPTSVMPTVAAPTSEQSSPKTGSTATGAAVTDQRRKPRPENTYDLAGSRRFPILRFAIPTVVVLIIGLGLFYLVQRGTNDTNVAKADQPTVSNSAIENDSTPAESDSAHKADSAPSPVKDAPKASPTAEPTPKPRESTASLSPFPEPNANIANTSQSPEPKLEAEDVIYNGSQVSERAKIVSRPRPQYTEEARKNQIEGSVVLRAIFTSEGEVTNIRVVSGLPFGLTERAIAATRMIKFTPAIKDGRSVSMHIQLEYNFSLY